MRLVTYSIDISTPSRFGFLIQGKIVDIMKAAIWCKDELRDPQFLEIPSDLTLALARWDQARPLLETLVASLPEELTLLPGVYDPEEIHFHPPVEHPSTIRDFYAFEAHAKAARKRQGLDMDPLWYQLPVFYFTNPNALCGHRQPVAYPEGTEELDFELELAIIIAQGGKNIPKEKAESYIAGYTIMNDWSARDWQREEMQLGLGPAKGKDFATSLGPALVTPDELPPGGLTMTAHLNDREVSRGNSADLAHSFAIMIERASRNVNLRPGDVIGSGTVGTGCILELGPENTGGWLKRGDHIRLEVEGLGVLENHII